MRDTLSESHLATPTVVGVIRRTVAAYAGAAGLPEGRLDDVRLAVSEAVTNVVRHAYPAERGQVHLTAYMIDNELWVLVSDDGRGYNVASGDPGLGWGLALITDACDEFTLVERAAGGTEARMRFDVAPSVKPLSSEDR